MPVLFVKESRVDEGPTIKRFRPRFNVLLRDDKSFPYILIARGHAAPQIMKHRGARKVKGDYYGPFASAGSVNTTINALQKLFLLRSCTDSFFARRDRPCLLYQIKRCSGPCVDLIDSEAYARDVADAECFLRGEVESPDLITQLEQAARIDGATRFQAFFLIVMPLSTPGIIATAIYSFIGAWNEYIYAYTFLNRQDQMTLPIGIQTFAKIRETPHYYVDKTPYALQLIDQGTHAQLIARGGRYAELAKLQFRAEEPVAAVAE